MADNVVHEVRFSDDLFDERGPIEDDYGNWVEGFTGFVLMYADILDSDGVVIDTFVVRTQDSTDPDVVDRFVEEFSRGGWKLDVRDETAVRVPMY